MTNIRHCGGGAYGEVYYCRDISGKYLALKVVSKAKLGSAWERELKGITNYRALSEATEGLLPIYHVEEDEESFFYTMEPADAVVGEAEYVPDTLAGRLERGALSGESLVPTLQGILKAIVSLHHAGFAHRDIKPENILFVKGKPCLADLGLLSPLSGTLTQLVGTLDFLPPEERSGETSRDSHASRQRNDLYAFGKIIYCCVTGNKASDFPSLPPELPLTLVNKLFFRLSLRLCDTEPSMRLNELEELVKEFERTIHICQYGESLGDKLRYAYTCILRSFRSRLLKIIHWLRRRPVAGTLVGCVLCAAAAGVAKYIAGRPDGDSEALAASLQEQKQIAAATEFPKKEFSFHDGVYTIAVPSDWVVFGREQIAAALLPGDQRFRYVQGLFAPDDDSGGNLDSIVAAFILPLSKEQIFGLSAEEQTALFKTHLGEDIEAISLKSYKNVRLKLDTILFTGEVQPSKATVNYIFPQSDHTVVLSALFPKANFQRDMGAFLAIVDSLSWRLPENEK